MFRQNSSRTSALACLRGCVATGLLVGSLSTALPKAAQAEPPTSQTQPTAIATNLPPEVLFAYQQINLRRAIIGQESGANFRAVNRHSGALGYGQVMPENVASWSREALGYSITPQQFLNSPQLQLQIIDHKLSQYLQQALRVSNGNEEVAIRRVASQWYSGRPHLYNSTTPQYYGGHRYPSIAEYTLSVLAKYRTIQNTVTAPAAAPAVNSLMPTAGDLIQLSR